MSVQETKLTVAIYLAHTAIGGVQRVLIDIANGLAKLGCNVDIVCDTIDGPMLEQLSPEVNRFELGASGARKQVLPLARYLRSRKPFAILAATELFNVVALLAKWIARSPVRLAMSSHTVPSAIAKNATRPAHRLLPRLIRIFYPFADEIIAVSDGVAKDVASLGHFPETCITLIPNPIDIDRVRTLGSERPQHPWFKDGTKIILGAGRFVPFTKNFEGLIQAFSKIQHRTDARLVLLGDGPERKNLETLIAEQGLNERVSLPGNLTNPYTEIAAADVFCLSSRWEGFGVVLVEAMAVGTPIVSVDCPGGPRGILKGGTLGALVPPDDIDALADALLDTLENPTQPVPDTELAPYRQEVVARQYKDVLIRPSQQINARQSLTRR